MNYTETLSNQIATNNQHFRHQGKSVTGWQLAYKAIQDPVKSTNIGEKNMDKNRYNNILPYDDNQVIIKGYINASWVNGWIATQWPLEETLTDFWQMIWEHRVTVIVALNKIERDDQYPYWFEVTNTITKQDFIIRTLNITIGNETRTMTHYQYTAWPDFKCPNVESLLMLMDHVNKHEGVKCIHCSAGVGRTGTYLTIDKCLNAIKNGEKVDVIETIKSLREQRTAMVQTPEQLAFCYHTLLYTLLKD